MFVARRMLMLLVVILLMALLCPASASFTRTGNVSEHSFIHLSGYMDEMKIYQTHKGFSGQKLVVGTQGSGMVSRTQTAYVTEDEIYFNEWGVFDYRPYLVESSESDLRNALCAKNYAMGTVISESYSDLTYLIKDTTVYQDDNVSVYQIGSHFRGTAKIGARVKNGSTGASVMVYGGTYIGDVMIREEIGVGDAFYLTCP
ncbi:MAG: hypothetical protein U9N48_07130 [Euryarchaeota archaeon]|nr:hypothetical protein [Euryarchaeota archaeon]